MHPWRWISTVVVLVLVARFVHGLATNPGWDWGTFGGYFLEKSIMEALLVTLQLTVAGAVLGFLGFLGGIVLAAMRLSGNPVLHTVSWVYTWVFRSVPLIVQLLFWANLGYLYPHPGWAASSNFERRVTFSVTYATSRCRRFVSAARSVMVFGEHASPPRRRDTS